MRRFLLLLVICMMGAGAASAQIFRSFDVKANFRSDFGFGVGTTINMMVPNLDLAPSFNYYFRFEFGWRYDL